ncbi:MAG: hypothetical protein IJU66_03735 [Oscillospiraceae bacterium]|nr:hypothetical protein [Oscillospiraceae bacterium]
MEAAARARFFKLLEKDIQQSHIRTNLVPPQDETGETLRAMLPVTDEGDPSLMEIMAVSFEEDADVLLFYTTMIGKIGPGYEKLLDVLPRWNLECPLGAYGVYDNQGMKQLYHKYNILFDPEIDPKELEENAMFHLTVLYEIISGKYEEARGISDGKA